MNLSRLRLSEPSGHRPREYVAAQNENTVLSLDRPNIYKGGHGAHVAGIIGETKYGIAIKTTLIAVRLFGINGPGSVSGVNSGPQWAVNDARSPGKRKYDLGALFPPPLAAPSPSALYSVPKSANTVAFMLTDPVKNHCWP